MAPEITKAMADARAGVNSHEVRWNIAARCLEAWDGTYWYRLPAGHQPDRHQPVPEPVEAEEPYVCDYCSGRGMAIDQGPVPCSICSIQAEVDRLLADAENEVDDGPDVAAMQAELDELRREVSAYREVFIDMRREYMRLSNETCASRPEVKEILTKGDPAALHRYKREYWQYMGYASMYMDAEDILKRRKVEIPPWE